MITNETRAKLIGWKLPTTGKLRTCDKCGWKSPESERPLLAPSYDTDANAVAELRAFVRARGKRGEFAIQLALELAGGDFSVHGDAKYFEFADATPQQQTAAFDAVFRDELERIQ